MLGKWIILAALAVTAALPASGLEPARLAILDFEVQSDNPAFKYLGKGFAEFLAVELSTARGIEIVERERRNALLEEQEFALSDLSQEAGLARAGELLSARYLLAGSIYDLFGQLAVTVRLLDVESGAVLASRQADGVPQQYRRLIGELAAAVTQSLDPGAAVSAPVVTVAAVDARQAETVLTSFSEAVDAVDRRDVPRARRSLQRAQRADRSDPAVRYYLSKLFAASPKFNVELVFYAPSYNPATLGFADKDRLYSTVSTNLLTPYSVQFPNPGGSHADFSWEVVPGLYNQLGVAKAELGYSLPLGSRWGLGAEVSTGGINNITRDRNYTYLEPGDDAYLRSGAMVTGGRLSAGVRLGERTAVGASAFVFNSRSNLGGSDGDDDPRSNTVSGSATLGFHSRLAGERLTLESQVTVPFLQEVYLDYREMDYIAYRTAPYPLVWETGLVGSALGGRLYLSLKEVAEIYLSFGADDRRGIASRTIPALEWWPTDFLALRAGAEFDLLSLMGQAEYGFGALGGLTVRLGRFDLDLNYTLMERALRFYPGLGAPDGAFLAQLSWNGARVKERVR